MTISDEIKAMEAGLAAAKIPVRDLCATAGINRASWQRWKAGHVAPNMATWGKAREAYERMMDQ